MVKKLLFVLVLLFVVGRFGLSAQESAPWRIRHLTADSLTIRLDTCSIIPQTFQIRDLNRTQYRLDPLTATLQLLDSSLLGTRIFVQYEVFPNDLSRPMSHKSPLLVESRRTGHQFLEIPSTSLPQVLNDGELYTNGAISRGVTVGNNQDLVLNSSLNLQISGKLSEDVQIMASVSDKNIPIQPEGNTQLLKDISSIFISLKIKEMATINAGDVTWTAPNDGFLRVSRNILGMGAKVLSVPSPKVKMFNEAGGGMAKGRFVRQTLTVQNGVRGPYKLYGADGEVSIVIVAGSERVYVDGQLMVRGAENDYTVDYNTAEITFTPKMLISAEKRVIVEFEYSNRHYSRYNLFTNNEIVLEGKRPLKLFVKFFHEQDLKNHSIQPELTFDNMRFLSELGDAGTVAYYPYADSVTYSPDRIFYEKIDTLINNDIYTIYMYSTNQQATLYSPDFSYMGVNKGNYKLQSSTANGRVFQWVAPHDGVPQGDYEAVLMLTTPISQQMATVGLDFSARENTRIQTEIALSRYDQNAFSKKDRNDDIGLAYSLNVTDVEKFAAKDSLPWQLKTQLQLQYVHKNFVPFESFREVEFARQYNLTSDYSANCSEWMLRAGVAMEKPQRHQFLYDLNLFDRVGEVAAVRNALRTDDRWQTWRLQTNTSYLLSRDSLQKSRYTVSRAQLTKKMGKVEFNIDNLLEHDIFKDAKNDSLRLNSYAFNELNAAVQSSGDTKHQFLLGYKNRTEFAPDAERLRLSQMIHEVRAQYRFAQIKNQSFSLNAIYRNQSLADSIGKRAPEHYFVGNVQYTGRFFRNALVLNTYYEAGSGMELKKSYTYIKVAAGQGTHVWIDYNGNGIEELDEFEVAKFPDEAQYVKVWIAGTDYVNVWQNQWTQSVQLRPAAVWAGSQGFRKFLSRFSNVFTLNALLNHKTRMFLPFAPAREDDDLVSDRLMLSNIFSFNNSSSPFAFDFIVQKTSNTQLLYYGIETNTVENQELVLKSTPIQMLYLQTSFLHKNTQNKSSYFSTRDYLVEAFSVGQEFRLQFQNQVTASMIGNMTYKRNRMGEEQLRCYRAELSGLYRMLNRGTVSLSVNYVYIQGNIVDNTTVAYFMLDGLNIGQNLLWTLSGQISVTSFLQLVVQYQGRAVQNHPVIHTGSVTLNAVF
jgi:hypothetical protein